MLSILLNSCDSCEKKRTPQQASELVIQAPDSVAAGTMLPQAALPVLKIGGKEDPDVYLQSLDIQVEVAGNIASTRYTMVFKNKTNRVLEGELTFPLPDGRSATHYALDINGKMREAVPVEKARGTQVFEEIQQREVDPGLLERVEGNNLRTRIYPIPGNGSRTISVGYEEELTFERGLLHYRLPMAYPDSLEKFSVKATILQSSQKPLVPESGSEFSFDKVDQNYVVSFARENFRPSSSLIFALPAPADIPQVIMQPAQGSHYFLASVVPNIGMHKKQWSDDLAIIWDVSLSGSQRNLQREIDMLDIIFSENKNAKVHLYFLNNRLKKNGEYKVANGKWDGLKKVLETAIFDGGTDFSQINLNDIAGNEILFFSDGISTLSDADFLKDAKENRPVHCIVSSAKADYSVMRLLSSKTKGKFVNINALSSGQLKNEILNETLLFLGAEHGKTVREVYPSITTPVQGNFSVAGISGANDAELTLLFGFGDKVEKRIKVQLDAKQAADQGSIYRIWAQKKIAELDLNYEKNYDELLELGRQFGIVTRNTSLIVLELISDYIRFGIEPPATEAELLAEYQRRTKGGLNDISDMLGPLMGGSSGGAGTKARGHLRFLTARDTDIDQVLKNVQGLQSDRKSEELGGRRGSATGGIGNMLGGSSIESDNRIRKKQGAGGKARAKATAPSSSVIGRLERDTFNGAVAAAENLKKWWNTDFTIKTSKYPTPDKRKINRNTISAKSAKGGDNDYLNKLTGKPAKDYQIYLKLRNDYANSPTFYFDMADWFYTLGDRETAIRILTSIADLELENASLYRLLGYKFKEYGEHTLQKFVCQKVIQWRPMEPQSYRDYALALADNGETQAALDSLYSLLTKSYSSNIRRRIRGIEEVVVTEINHLIAKNPRLNTSKIDKLLLINIPVDIRVVINWNMNNADIDLHVKDPNNEECSYSKSQTSIGGRISADNTSGYGPEQFLLKKAVKGKYQVYVNYFSKREFAADGPSTVMAEIYTKYGDKSEQRQVVSLQMANVKRTNDNKILVAEFEF